MSLWKNASCPARTSFMTYCQESNSLHFKIQLSPSTKKKDELVYANRYILSKLPSTSGKCGKPVDFQKALTYPLYPFPLGMTFSDGCKQETSKSKFLEEIIPEISEKRGEINIAKSQCVHVIDMIIKIRVCLLIVPNNLSN